MVNEHKMEWGNCQQIVIIQLLTRLKIYKYAIFSILNYSIVLLIDKYVVRVR